MIFIGLLALLIPAVLLRAWVISWLWLWFIVPLGVHGIGMAWAVGISCCISLFHSGSAPKEENAVDGMAKVLNQLFLAPLISIGIGWITHLAMIA